jgi:hypothetical protein
MNSTSKLGSLDASEQLKSLVRRAAARTASGLNLGKAASSNFDDLNRLIRAAEPIHDRVAWRSRRSASQSIFAYLQRRLSPEEARAVATGITGVEPEPWMTISEAEAALQALGVKIGGRTLYRLYNRAVQSGDGERAVKLNVRGDWHPVSSTTLPNPIAILKIRVSGPVHFMVVPICNDSIEDKPSVESP